MLQRYGKLFEKQNKIMFFDVLLLRNEKKKQKKHFFYILIKPFHFLFVDHSAKMIPPVSLK